MRVKHRSDYQLPSALPGCAAEPAHIPAAWRPIMGMVLLVGLLPAVASAQTPPAAGLAREQYVPADQLDAIFERDRRGVLLPRAELLELLQKAEARAAQQQEHPAEIVAEQTTIAVRPVDQHALVQMDIRIRQYADGWQVLRLPVGHLQVEQAQIAGLPAAAVGRDPQLPDVLVVAHATAGEFTLQLSLSTPLASVGSDRTAAFQLPRLPATQLQVTCPAGQQLLINDLKLQRPAADDAEAVYSVPVGAAEQVRLQWTASRRQDAAQTLVFVHTDAALQVQPEALRWTSRSVVSVFGSTINQLTLRVPQRLEVTTVASTGLESWKLEDDPDHPGQTRVILTYRQPFTDDRLVELHGIAALQGTTGTAVPTLEFANVTAHTGRIAIGHADGLRLLAVTGGGIRATAAQTAEDRAFIQDSRVSVFDFWMQQFELSVSVRSRDQELFSELVSVLSIQDTALVLKTTVTLETLNAPLFEVPLTLPADWQLVSVTGSGNPLPWRTAGDVTQIVVTPLTAVPPDGLLELQLELVRTLPDPETEQKVTLPVVLPVRTTLAGGSYTLQFADDLDVSPVVLSGLRPVAGSPTSLSFQNLGTSISGELSIRRRPARLASRSVLRMWSDSRQTTLQADVTVDVLHGTVRELQLRLPEQLGTDVRFSVVAFGPIAGAAEQAVVPPVQVIQQSAGEPADGRRPFVLKLDRRFAGSLTLRTTVQRPRTAEAAMAAPTVLVQDAVRQHGVLVFEAYPEQQLQADQDISQLPGVFPADAGLTDAPPAGSGRRVALTYRFVQPEYALTVSETRFGTEVVPTAVVEAVRHVSTLNASGSVQRWSRAEFRASGVQTLRFRLPEAESCFLWSTILNGDPVEVRRDAEDYLVALPAAGQEGRQILEVLFEAAEAAGDTFGTIEQRPLQFWIDGGSAQPIPVDVLRQDWDVRYPANSLLVDSGGHFHALTGTDQPGWFREAFQLRELRLPELLRRVVPLLIFLLVVFILTVLVVRRRWIVLAVVCVLGGPLLLVLLLLPMLMLGGMAAPARAARELAAGTVLSRETQALPAPATDADMSLHFEVNGRANLSDLETAAGLPGMGPAPGGAYAGELGGGVVPALPGLQAEMGLGAGGAGTAPATSGGYPAGGQPWAGPPVTGPFGFAQTTPPSSNAADALAQAVPPAPAETQAFDEPLPEADAAAPAVRKGSARLSVRVGLEVPEDYRSREFRSVGDAVRLPAALQLVVQRQDHIAALRLVAAVLAVLLCWRLRDAAVAARFTTVVVVLLAAAAAVPLLPNQWQSVLDGVIVGTVAGGCVWTGRALCGCLTVLRTSVSQLSCRLPAWLHFRRRSAASSVAVLISAAACASVCGQGVSRPVPADPIQPDQLHPDVVVPYAPDEPALRAERVFIPHEQFLQLYRAAYPDALPSGTVSPLGSTVVAAFYRTGQPVAVAEGRYTLAVTARYVVFSDSDQPVEIVLPLGAVGIRRARLDEQAAVLKPVVLSVQPQPATQNLPNTGPVAQQAGPQRPTVPAADSGMAVLVPQRGAHVVDIEFDVPVSLELGAENAGSVGRVDLPLRPVPAGTLEFQLPDGELDVKVNGRSNVFRRDGRTLLLPISEAGDLRIQWQPAAARQAADVVFHAQVTTALAIQDAGLTWRSTLDLVPRQGELSELQVSLPEAWVVQSVQGDDVASWSVQNTDSTRSLQLLFRRAIGDRTRVTLQLYAENQVGADRASLAVPVPVVRGATRDLGTVVLLAGNQFQVRSESLSGVTQINPEEAQQPDGPPLEGRPVLAWRYTRHPAAVTVRATRQTDQLQVQTRHAVRLEAQRLLWSSQLTAQIAGVPRSRIEIQVPRNLLVLDVAATGMNDWYFLDSRAAAGEPPAAGPDSRILCVQLEAARVGQVQVALQGQLDRVAGQESLLLQPLNVLDATEMSSQLAVWLDSASENAGVEAGDWTPLSPSAIDSVYASLVPVPPAAAFRSESQRPGGLTLKLRHAIPTVIAESVTVSNATDTSLEVTLALNWLVTRAAADTFAVELPTLLAGSLTFEVPGQRRLLREDLGNGRTRVTFYLQQPVSDRLFVVGGGSLPLPTEGLLRAEAPLFTVVDGGAVSLAGQSHFWVLVNQSAGLLQPSADHKRFEVVTSQITTEIPRELLEQSVTVQRLTAETPAWQLTFPKSHQVAPAVVTLASHLTVVSDDGSWRSRHQLQVQNVSRQFLPVQIPEGSRVLYCLVRGQPSRMVRQTSGDSVRHLIPIPQSGAIAAAFEVEFALAGMFAESVAEVRERWQSDRLALPVPVFPEFREDAEFGVSVSRNRWTVYVPESWSARLVDDPRLTNVVPADEAELQDVSLLSQVEQAALLLNSLKSVKDSVSRRNLAIALEQQRQSLGVVTGNSAAAEAERGEVLQKLSEQNVLGDGLQLGAGLPGAVPSSGTTLLQPDGVLGNSGRYLYEQDALQNLFGLRSRGRFIEDNGLRADQADQSAAEVAEQRFRFQVTVPDDPQVRFGRPEGAEAARDKERREEEVPGKAVKGAEEQPQSPRQQSRLLERRSGAAVAGQPQASEPVPEASEAAVKENVMLGLQLPAVPQDEYSVAQQQTLQAGDSGAAGVLSLLFDVPTAGYRLDFIRTGGNPSLTLEVRSEKVVSRGSGLLWAALCTGAALLLTVISRRHQNLVFVHRLCLFLVVASCAGWLLLAPPLHGFCLLLCVLSSLAVCVLTIMLSFRRGTAVPG